MAQAANVIAFPTKKLSFRAKKIDLRKLAAKYDERKPHMLFALALLGKSPKELKRGFGDVETAAKSGEFTADIIDRLIYDTHKMASEYLGLAELLQSTIDRLIAVQRKMI